MRLRHLLLLMFALCGPSAAADDGPLHRHAVEWGFIAGAGIAHELWGGRADAEIVTAGVRFGYILTGGERATFEISGEVLPVFLLYQGERTFGSGFTLLFRHHFNPHGVVIPTLTWGAGFVYTRDTVPTGVSQINFTPQFGAGVSFRAGSRTLLGIEYRIHHLSNGGRVLPNPGINSSVVQVSVTFF